MDKSNEENRENMKKKLIIPVALLVVVLALTAFGCTQGQTSPKYETYVLTTDEGTTTYYLADNGKWQNSNGDMGTYLDKNGTLYFFDTNKDLSFVGEKFGKTIAFESENGTVFAVNENATEEERLISVKTVYDAATAAGFDGTLDELIAAFKGKSAYESAVENGFVGTEAQWIASLTGRDGLDGKDGKDGLDGVSIAGIRKTGTTGNVDTYTITMTDGTKFAFTVTNGSGENAGSGSEESVTPTKRRSEVATMLLNTVSISRSDGGAGSGIIYSIDKEKGDALIITNAHMVYNDDRRENDPEYFDTVKVYLYGSEIAANEGNDAEEMGIDAQTIGACQLFDVAVLKITGSEIIKNSVAEAATFTDSDGVYQGEDVFVVGNANGYGIAVAQGIVSKTSQNVPFSSLSNSNVQVYHRVIRVDAAINPGNSGGGIFNANAQAIGIVIGKTSATLTESLGYCIPSNVVLAVAKNIIKQYQQDPSEIHAFVRPLLGVTIYAAESHAVIDDETGFVTTKESVKVLSVSQGMLADGNFEVNDVVRTVSINGGEAIEVDHVYVLTDSVMALKAGDEVKFVVERAGADVEFTITITEDALTVTQ